MTTRSKELALVNDVDACRAGGQMIVASRYAECLHRLARQASDLNLEKFADRLTDVANLIEGMAGDTAVDERGGIVLRRADRYG
ncbi:hypothetical protein [Rhizobium sp. 2MFCol3.1]|uniref:hypothetical protein n=1 Tax=Rhizobium sp. 2MFCol3.1 TaxID=1246459 RepID=UPI00038289C5|nr:hypothetical protein [Rhizobium sp. 2MFCol3.1]